jgi:hypothetical protein
MDEIPQIPSGRWREGGLDGLRTTIRCPIHQSKQSRFLHPRVTIDSAYRAEVALLPGSCFIRSFLSPVSSLTRLEILSVTRHAARFKIRVQMPWNAEQSYFYISWSTSSMNFTYESICIKRDNQIPAHSVLLGKILLWMFHIASFFQVALLSSEVSPGNFAPF